MALSPSQASKTFQADDDLVDHEAGTLAMNERLISLLRAELAAKYQVPVDAVDVAVEDNDGEVSLSYAIIFIPASDLIDVVKLLSPNTSLGAEKQL